MLRIDAYCYCWKVETMRLYHEFNREGGRNGLETENPAAMLGNIKVTFER